ncbi:hypothetical protein NMY22_g15959 [Coprinellus aureogranulatus]|nr:hypothetical protein NMY22_g15959 [Coprinellus aureogranulatus]
MVRVCSAAVVAALVITPAIAAPVAQPVEDFEARAFDDFENEYAARSEGSDPALEARAGMALRFVKNGLLPATGMFATVLGGMTAAKPLLQPKEGRSFDDFEELDARTLKRAAPLVPPVKAKSFLSRLLPWASTAASTAAVGAGIGVGTLVNSKSRRELEEDVFERSLEDELLEVRELDDLLDFYSRAFDLAMDFDDLD